MTNQPIDNLIDALSNLIIAQIRHIGYEWGFRGNDTINRKNLDKAKLEFSTALTDYMWDIGPKINKWSDETTLYQVHNEFAQSHTRNTLAAIFKRHQIYNQTNVATKDLSLGQSEASRLQQVWVVHTEYLNVWGVHYISALDDCFIGTNLEYEQALTLLN